MSEFFLFAQDLEKMYSILIFDENIIFEILNYENDLQVFFR